jgi:hypothetical protein
MAAFRRQITSRASRLDETVYAAAFHANVAVGLIIVNRPSVPIPPTISELRIPERMNVARATFSLHVNCISLRIRVVDISVA